MVLKVILTTSPFYQYCLKLDQIVYVFYLVLCVASMFVITKVTQFVLGMPKVKKTTRRTIKNTQAKFNRIIQVVERKIWSWLETPFSHRQNRKKRRHKERKYNEPKGSRRRFKPKIPRLWQANMNIKPKRYGPRSHFIKQLAKLKPPKCRIGHYATTIATMAARNTHDSQEGVLSWDSDSFTIGIDQHTSSPISNDKNHFINLQNTTAKVVGVDGVPRGIAAGKGTLQWLVEDDEGVVHKWKIPNAYYIPDCPKCLLPPQFFAKYGNTNREKTQCLQLWDRTVLKWGPNGEFTKTIWLGHDRAVPDMTSAASTKTYSAYSNMLDIKSHVECFEVSIPHFIEDYESDQDTSNETSNKDIDEDTIVPINSQLRGEGSMVNEKTHDENLTDLVNKTTVVNQSAPHVIENDGVVDTSTATDTTLPPSTSPTVREIPQDQDFPATSDQAELLRWHYRLGHISFFKLRTM